MEQKLLLTPGPLSTSKSVKEAMLYDLGTRDQEYGDIVQETRAMLLEVGQADASKYSVVLLQGSGTYAVESVLTSYISKQDKVLILANGAYGKRMALICEKANICHDIINFDMTASLPLDELTQYIKKDEYTHVAFIHMETTAGIQNNLAAINQLCKTYHKKIIVDAMSCFGGVQTNLDELDLDFLITSSNKCIQGVPGLGIIYGKHEAFKDCKGNAHSLSLDLYDQYKEMEDKQGSFRFTSPTHVLLALHCALKELIKEGGVSKRSERYATNQAFIKSEMMKRGFKVLVKDCDQSNVITTFMIPEGFDFDCFYDYLKKRNFLLYSGKLPGIQAFRIGNIGEIYLADCKRLMKVIDDYLKENSLCK
ncbi:MAG: 2-aminoethylphosphonate--pyruvate transaminase [Erysipelotrichaceae bacterium]